jgi:hypothetical protein
MKAYAVLSSASSLMEGILVSSMLKSLAGIIPPLIVVADSVYVLANTAPAPLGPSMNFSNSRVTQT